jgi:hypothetical protein
VHTLHKATRLAKSRVYGIQVYRNLDRIVGILANVQGLTIDVAEFDVDDARLHKMFAERADDARVSATLNAQCEQCRTGRVKDAVVASVGRSAIAA